MGNKSRVLEWLITSLSRLLFVKSQVKVDFCLLKLSIRKTLTNKDDFCSTLNWLYSQSEVCLRVLKELVLLLTLPTISIYLNYLYNLSIYLFVNPSSCFPFSQKSAIFTEKVFTKQKINSCAFFSRYNLFAYQYEASCAQNCAFID